MRISALLLTLTVLAAPAANAQQPLAERIAGFGWTGEAPMALSMGEYLQFRSMMAGPSLFSTSAVTYFRIANGLGEVVQQAQPTASFDRFITDIPYGGGFFLTLLNGNGSPFSGPGGGPVPVADPLTVGIPSPRVAVAPEPATTILLVTGLLGMAVVVWRRRSGSLL